MELFDKYEQLLGQTETIRSWGEIQAAKGIVLESLGPICKQGELCTIELEGGKTAFAEVLAFDGKKVQMGPLTDTYGIVPGSAVYSKGRPLEVLVGDELIGRVLDGLGRPLDGKSLNFFHQRLPVVREPLAALDRPLIKDRLWTGVRAIDGLLTLGKGQRVGIFSGSGVGKSTLLGMMARGTSADVVVVALVGERRREVLEFVERDLGPEGMKRSVVLVATNDDPPWARVRCLYSATTIAEYFRDQGKDVLLIVDSVTRAAMAQREIGSALGEIPVSKGYPPSVTQMLARVLERPGTSKNGTITGIYNVLVEGGDADEPVSDAVRGIVDGHIMLDRGLAAKSHYPPIEVTHSVSRLMMNIAEPEHKRSAATLREWLSAYRDVEPLLTVGAYARGSQPAADQAISRMDAINRFLRQDVGEVSDPVRTLEDLAALTGGGSRARPSGPTGASPAASGGFAALLARGA